MENSVVFFACTSNQESSSFSRLKSLNDLANQTLGVESKIVNFGLNKSRMPSTLKKINNTVFCLKRVKKFLKHNNPKLIFTVFMGIRVMKWLKKYCHQKNIVLVCDFCEWVIKDQFKFGGLSYGYIKNNYAITKWVNKDSNTIAISSYLNNHFLFDKKCNSIRVPNLIYKKDYSFKPTSTKENERKQLIFIGNSSRKDFSDRIIDALYNLPSNLQEKICIHMIGINLKKRVNAKINKTKMNELIKKGSLTVKNQIPYQKVVELYDRTLFSLFFYESDDRNAKALFPTKLLDAFKNSKPVICNLATDIGMYVQDGYNGLIAKDNSEESIEYVLKRVISLDSKKINELSKNAFETIQVFDVKEYINDFKSFIRRTEYGK